MIVITAPNTAHWKTGRYLALAVGLVLGIWAIPALWIPSAQAHDFGGNTNPNPPPPPPPPPPPCKDRCCENGTGKPVSWLDGAERLRETDLRVAGVYAIVISREYDSASTYDTPLGYGWAFAHDRRLFEYPDGSVVIRHGCGQRDRYVQTGGAYVTPNTGVRGQLTENADGSFVFAYYDGSFDHYDAEGRLAAEIDAQGNRHEIFYADSTGDGRPDKFPLTGTSPNAVDPNVPMTVALVYRVTRIQERTADNQLTGRHLDFAYDEVTGRLSSVTSDDGRTLTYSHDQTAGATRGNLVGVAGPGDRVQTFAYADPKDDHNLTSIQLAAGDTPYVNTYDAQGRVISQTQGLRALAFSYPASRTRTVVTRTVKDPAGTVLHTAQSTHELDTDGFPKTVTDALGNQTRYFYDTAKNLTSEEIWDKRTGSLVLLKRTVYGYNAAGDRTSEVVTLDTGEVVTRTWTYDQGWVTSEQVVSSLDPAKVFRTEYTLYYDTKGIPTNIKEVKRRRDDGSFQTTVFTYDAKRRLLTTTLPDGVKIVNQYASGSLYVTKTYYKDSAGTVLPELQQRFGYDAAGNLTDVWDARNNQTHSDYDAQGRIIAVTNALGEQTLYTYTGEKLTQKELGRTAADGEGQVTQFLYDGRNDLIETRRKDDAGNFLTFETYTYDSDGNRLSVTDAVGNTTRFAYDALGRLSATTDALNNITGFAYDAAGNRIKTTDALGRETRSVYDDLDRVIRTEQAGIVPPAITHMRYDAAGNVIAVTDAESHTTTFNFDALSRNTMEVMPLGQTLTYVYDTRDRLDYRLTARGHKIDYSYAPWGPVVKEEVFNPGNVTTTPDETILYSYDTSGNLTSTAYDAVKPLTDPLYSVSYDVLNRSDVTTIGYIPNKTVTVDNDYDRYGNRQAFTLNDGQTLVHSYIYNKLNRLVQVSLPGSQIVDLDYYANDKRQRVYYAGGFNSGYSYLANGVIKEIKVTDGGSGSVEKFDYVYDPVLNVDRQNDSDGIHDFAYDGLDRLTEATHPSGVGLPEKEGFSYDLVGNREDSSDLAAYQYDANNRIVNSPGLTYQSDEDGSQTGRSNGDVFAYNGFNRLVAYTRGATTTVYAYSPLGPRLKKGTPAQSVYFLWDNDRLIAEYDGNGYRSKDYLYLPGDSMPIQFTNATKRYHVYGDHLQAPRILIDANTEQLAWRSRLYAYGQASVNDDVDGDGIRVDFGLRFPGQYYDPESGLHYNYSRDYDPILGRYLQRDPLGFVDGTNTYAYTKGNPVRFVDPLGLATCGSGWNEPFVPDNPWGFSFSSCCQGHDDCYGNCGKTKAACDTGFLDCMKGACKKVWIIFRLDCLKYAYLYYKAVDWGGQSAYDDAHKDCCK